MTSLLSLSYLLSPISYLLSFASSLFQHRDHPSEVFVRTDEQECVAAGQAEIGGQGDDRLPLPKKGRDGDFLFDETELVETLPFGVGFGQHQKRVRGSRGQ